MAELGLEPQATQLQSRGQGLKGYPGDTWAGLSPYPLPTCRPLTVVQAVSHCPGRPPITNQYHIQTGCVFAQPEATAAFL